MAKLNISQAAKLYGKDWKTVKRHIEKGTLSQGNDGLIDMAELVRAYGEPVATTSPTPEEDNRATPENASPEIKELFGQQIRLLERQVEDLREERDKLLGIVEKQTLMLEYHREKDEPPEAIPPQKSDRWLTWTLGGLTLIVSVVAVVAIAWLVQHS